MSEDLLDKDQLILLTLNQEQEEEGEYQAYH